MKIKYTVENPGKPPVTVEIDTEKERLEKDYERTHPSAAPRAEDCCGSALNYQD